MSRIAQAKKRIEQRTQSLQLACFEDRYIKPPLYPVEEVRFEDWVAHRSASVAEARAYGWSHTLD
jgi:hypothetical protein